MLRTKSMSDMVVHLMTDTGVRPPPLPYLELYNADVCRVAVLNPPA
jgi:hypothetical protein